MQRDRMIYAVKSRPSSVKFVDIIRASKHKKKRMRSKSRDLGRSYEMNLGQNNSHSIANEIPESSSSSTSIDKTSTISKLRSKAVIRKSKRRTMSKGRSHYYKQHGIKDTVDMVDYISSLPDCILHHILSYVLTKEAVKTSILSTRWKSLWVSVPNLDVDTTEVDDDCHPHKLTSFKNFLERVLRLRGASNINRFRLTCSDSSEESQIHSWISDAINHNVQELEISNYGGVPSMFPWSVLDATSIVSLKITTSFVGELPSCISFPCLKTLQLLSVVFPNDDQAQKLLLGCPVVEELVLLEIWFNLNNFLISNSTLKRLTISDILMFGMFDDPTRGCKIKIDAENLTYFKYSGFLSNKILLNNAPPSLVKACIDLLPRSKCQKVVACRAVNLLKRLQHVVSLSVSETAIQSLRFADNMRARFPVFENLSHLILTAHTGNKTFGALKDFLHFCPVVQSICLSQGYEHHIRVCEKNAIWLSSPACVSNCLKTVTLEDFHAYDSEVCFIKSVLKYARVLERMDILWSETEKLNDVKKTEEVETELETIERISTACVINFF